MSWPAAACYASSMVLNRRHLRRAQDGKSRAGVRADAFSIIENRLIDKRKISIPGSQMAAFPIRNNILTHRIWKENQSLMFALSVGLFKLRWMGMEEEFTATPIHDGPQFRRVTLPGVVLIAFSVDNDLRPQT